MVIYGEYISKSNRFIISNWSYLELLASKDGDNPNEEVVEAAIRS